MGWCCGDPGDCLHLDKVAEDWRHTSHHSTSLDEHSDFFILSYFPDLGYPGELVKEKSEKADLHSHSEFHRGRKRENL